MHVALFGSSGRTGLYVLEELIRRRHAVKTLVRSLKSLSQYSHHQSVEIIEGDAEDEDSVSKTLKNTSAVISALGHRNSHSDMQTIAIAHILKAMMANEIRRIIVLTGAGIFFPEDKPNIVDRCIAMMIKLIDPHRFSDAKAMCQRIQESSVDWTIVRTNIQHNRCSKKPYKTGMLGMPGATSGINRKLLAQFIVDCLEKDLFIQQAPVVWE